MVKYNATHAAKEQHIFSPVQVAIGLAEARESIAQHMSDMTEIDGMIDHATIALSILNNFKGNEAQAVALVNHQHAMENLLGVVESKITVSAAKEGLGDALSAAWKRIKEFISWLVQKIKDFFVWIGKKIGLIKDKAEDTAKKMNSSDFDKKKCQQFLIEHSPKNGSASNESLGSGFTKLNMTYVCAVGHDALDKLLKDFEQVVGAGFMKAFQLSMMEPPDISGIQEAIKENFGEKSESEIEDIVNKQTASIIPEAKKEAEEMSKRFSFITASVNDDGQTQYDIKDLDAKVGSYAQLGYTPDNLKSLMTRVLNISKEAADTVHRLETLERQWKKFEGDVNFFKGSIPNCIIKALNRSMRMTSSNIKAFVSLCVKISQATVSVNDMLTEATMFSMQSVLK